MGIALTFAGVMLIVTGAQNTYAALGSQLRGDFTGQNNFTYWFLALVVVGMIGYIPALRTFSRWFLALIFIALLFSHRGFFSQLTQALQQGPKSPQVPNSSPSNSAGSNMVSPAQGVAQGNTGVSINWLAPFKNVLPSLGLGGSN